MVGSGASLSSRAYRNEQHQGLHELKTWQLRNAHSGSVISHDAVLQQVMPLLMPAGV